MTALKKGSIDGVFNVQKARTVQIVREEKGVTKFTFDLPAAAKTQLDYMALEMKKSRKDLMAEALNMLFKKYDKPEIAE